MKKIALIAAMALVCALPAAAQTSDWRTPDPGWDYMTSPAIVDVQPWSRPRHPFP